MEASASRRFWLATVTLLLGTLFALSLGEFGLRVWRQQLQDADQMDSGLMRHDDYLGWRLRSGWVGGHRSADFAVTYRVSAKGWRQTPGAGTGRPRVVVLGDSFTFGIGVEDGQTFVARLAAADPDRAYLNLGVPGYSTDQETWLAQWELAFLRPRHILLMVYLGNDLYDNPRRIPLQAPLGKPRLMFQDGRWIRQAPPSDAEVVRRGADTGWLARKAELPPGSAALQWLRGLEWARWSGLLEPTIRAQRFEGRFDTELALFAEWERRLARLATDRGARLSIVLLPGRARIERPGHLAGAAQEALRRAILARPAPQGVERLDLTPEMSQLFRQRGVRLFHPHEGHLSQAGHQVVARLLREAMPVAETPIASGTVSREPAKL